MNEWMNEDIIHVVITSKCDTNGKRTIMFNGTNVAMRGRKILIINWFLGCFHKIRQNSGVDMKQLIPLEFS